MNDGDQQEEDSMWNVNGGQLGTDERSYSYTSSIAVRLSVNISVTEERSSSAHLR